MRTLRVVLLFSLVALAFSVAPPAKAQCVCTAGCHLKSGCFYCDFCIWCCSVCTVDGCRYCQEEPCPSSAPASVTAGQTLTGTNRLPCEVTRSSSQRTTTFVVVRLEDASTRT